MAAGVAVFPGRRPRSRPHPRAKGRCCWSATTAAATCRPTPSCSHWRSARTSASSGRSYQLAHNLVVSMPGLGWLRKFGTVAANHDNATLALKSGAAVLVYPGGDYEVFRPSWKRHEVDFGGRKGYVQARPRGRCADRAGGQRRRPGDGACSSDRGQWLAKLLMVDKMLRLKSVPISAGAAVGLTSATVAPFPLPAEDRDRGAGTDRGARHRDELTRRYHDEGARQPAGRRRPAGRRATIPGDRLMRVERRISVNAGSATPCGRWSATRSATRRSCRTWNAGKRVTEGPARRRRRATPCYWKIGSVPVGGVIEVVEFDRARDLAWIGITGVTLRGRFRLRDAARRPDQA